ncbi:MAG: YcxB family protein [Cyanobacteriota bacterium erpe_2018_sw_21hr_WHONDRS-SW48-000092_B_bin.40]|nr:YcxB family protein [Cyanobacteriota bacterium erpe_2018_sw_21hr_WHONDRS-SW48-000092_B_bin.40]
MLATAASKSYSSKICWFSPPAAMSEYENTSNNDSASAYWLDEPYVIVVSYQDSEVNNASWLVYKKETAEKLVITAFCIALLVTTIIVLRYLGIFTDSPLPEGPYQSWIKVSLFIAVLLVPPLFACWLWQLIKATQLNTFAREPRYRSPVTYTLSSAGFQFSTAYITMLSPWSETSACYELAQSLTLYSDKTIIPIPKRCFASAEQLNKVRKLIIDSEVAYSKLGPQEADIVFAGAPKLNNLERNKVEQESAWLAKSSESKDWQPSAKTLTIECNYSLKELTNVEKKLFPKYSLTFLGIRYIGFILFGYFCSLLILCILGEAAGSEINTAIFRCAPLIIPIFFIHALCIFRERVDGLRKLVDLDLPVSITFSEDKLTVRSRRNLIANPWANFLNCFATKDHYICRSLSVNVIVPKSSLDSQSKEIFVENLLRTKIKRYEEWS